MSPEQEVWKAAELANRSAHSIKMPQVPASHRAAILATVEDRVRAMLQDISGREWWIRRNHQAADTKRYENAEARNDALMEVITLLNAMKAEI